MAKFKFYDGTQWVELLKSSDISAWAKKSSLEASDVPNLDASKITTGTFNSARIPDLSSVYLGKSATAADSSKLNGQNAAYYLNYNNFSNTPNLGTAASKDTGTSAGNIPVLDANGKLSSNVLPSIAITDTFTAASQSAMTQLSAQKGDICIRTDENKTYVLSAEPASTASNWKEILTPTGGVGSVNGQTGAVTLTASDVGAIPISGTSALTGNIVPNSNNSINLGSASYYFNNIYGRTLNSGKLQMTSGQETASLEPWQNGDLKIYLYDGANADSVIYLPNTGNDETVAYMSDVPTQTTVSNWGFTKNTGTVIGSSLTADYFVLGNETVNVKASSMKPTTSSTTWSSSSDVNVPTMKAISNYVTSLGYLPLSAGPSNALTGDLYVGSHSVRFSQGAVYSDSNHLVLESFNDDYIYIETANNTVVFNFADGNSHYSFPSTNGAENVASREWTNTKYTYQTTAPTAAISDGGIHIVYLTSEPTTKYSGYIYLIAES